MEKDLGKINKNDTTDIVLRLDDFGGRRGLTIREFVTSDRYTGFTKSGVKILADNFLKFKKMINSISEEEMKEAPEAESSEADKKVPKEQETLSETVDKSQESGAENENDSDSVKEDLPDY